MVRDNWLNPEEEADVNSTRFGFIANSLLPGK